MKNVIIEGTGSYVPSNKVYNKEINAHFAKRGLDASHLMEHLGRRTRYFISEGENAITMCKNAIDDCINKNEIQLEDIEMIVFCSDTPEYLTPSNAMKLTGIYAEKLKNVTIAFDLNSNCTGMIQGIDVVTKYMKLSSIKKALVVGCFCISPIALWADTVVYANFADASACAVLKSEEAEERCGVIDTRVYIDASNHEYVTYPKCGLSKVPLKNIEPNEKRLEWRPFSMDGVPEGLAHEISSILEKNDLTKDDIDYYIFSQLSDAYNTEALKILGEPKEKYNFLGGEYGYTGNTCPILCLDKMWDTYAKRGNKLILSTIGAGFAMITQLYEF